MAKLRDIPADLVVRIDARQHFRLSHAQVQMACVLGLNPMRNARISALNDRNRRGPPPINAGLAFVDETGTVGCSRGSWTL